MRDGSCGAKPNDHSHTVLEGLSHRPDNWKTLRRSERSAFVLLVGVGGFLNPQFLQTIHVIFAVKNIPFLAAFENLLLL